MPATARRLIDAFLAGDAPSAAALLAPDARFHSLVRDYVGADQIDSVWRALAGVLQNGRSTSVHERDGETIAFFAATIKGQPVDGVMRAVTDEEHRASDITVMVRPWAALKAGIADIKVSTHPDAVGHRSPTALIDVRARGPSPRLRVRRLATPPAARRMQGQTGPSKTDRLPMQSRFG
jgi:SnoaL-like domain